MLTWDPGQVSAAINLCSKREGQVRIEEAVLPCCNAVGQGLQAERYWGLREPCLSLIFGVAPAVRTPACKDGSGLWGLSLSSVPFPGPGRRERARRPIAIPG